jgi:calpain-15
MTQIIPQKTVSNPPLMFGQAGTALQKKADDLNNDDIAALSKAGKDMFSNAFTKSSSNSPFKDAFDQVKLSGQKFKDLEFPANIRSLLGGMDETDIILGGTDIDWRSLIWMRPDEIFGKGKFKIFCDSIEPNDIKQGELGDCYFLSTLASIAEKPARIRKLFETEEVNEQGMYGIKVCDKGEWKTVIIDDLIPCRHNTKQPVFTKGNGNEIWVLLLEKAWAKLYGGYAKIEAGLTRESLHDLTGGPAKTFMTGDPKVSGSKVNEDIWAEIKTAEEKDFIMTCGAGDLMEGQDILSTTGLVGSHAYSLLSAMEVTDKSGKVIRLLKIRNPWGQSEWTGDWSDNSPLWTSELKTKVGLENRDDGIFFMAYEDFLTYFTDIQVCKVHDDYIYKSLKITSSPTHATYLKLTIRKAGHYYITANQESKRKYLESEGYKYSEVAIVLAKKNGKGFEYVEGFQRSDKEVWTEGELAPGEYIVYVKVDWYKKQDNDFTFGVYGSGDASIEKVPKSYCPDFLEKTYMSRGRVSPKLKSYADCGVNNCYRAVETTDDGFGYVYYRNESNKALYEELYFKVMEGIKLRKPFRGNCVKIDVKPGEEKCVVTKTMGTKYRLQLVDKVKFT